MTTQNWPDPKHPGVPMFPDRSGKHAVSGKLLFWYSDIQKWVTSIPISATKEPNYFAECEYHGPVLTHTQINEMLAAERQWCADACRAMSFDNHYTKTQRDALEEAENAIRNLGAAP
ncbi:hypothetical protein [Acetobacter pasteurianus]|uniref:Uncharacterized protein n=1 Tax=Acetobacter pasteurianus subsp. pasteurianus TaxID=481145 RepID=A0A1Y0Y3M3_ACEPA|nr:hypothetical protein [Acetobacter pasteurianus]ARW48101.1 hypothetical protein S1001342_01778 [Acetobacter pasteurianus subsp. pasteurianus]